MDKQTFLEILGRCTDNTATDDEKAVIDSYYHLFEKDKNILKNLTPKDKLSLELRIKSRIEDELMCQKPNRKLFSYWKYAAAIFLLCFIAYSSFDWWGQKTSPASEEVSIVPGTNSATLMLANGDKIKLSDNHGGIVMADAIVYEDGSLVDGAYSHQMLTLETPRGGQYQVTLPDGTKVWLNAASSLQYPAEFDRGERRVKLQGEAFFDVAESKMIGLDGKRSKIPFIVESEAQVIHVLGTQFNVSAYQDDDSERTTLVEGRVQVETRSIGMSAKTSNTTLIPGQQLLLSADHIAIRDVDAKQYKAWTEGKFIFEKEPLDNILRKLARWYNVDIVYNDSKKSYGTFTGSLGRYEHIRDVLDKISLTQAVTFQIEGRRIVVI